MTVQSVSAAYRGPDRRLGGQAPGACYQGPDRRRRAPIATERASRIWYAVVALSALVVAAVGIKADMDGGQPQIVALAALRDTGAGLLVLSGTVLLVLWGLQGRARKARDGSALLFAGGGLLIFSAPWGALMHHSGVMAMISPAARIAIGLPCVVMLLRSGAVEPVNSAIHPARALARIGTGALALVALESVVRFWGPLDNAPVLESGMGLLGVCWIAAGSLRLVRRRRLHGDLGGRVGFAVALAVYGVGAVFLAMGFRLALTFAVVGAALQLLAAAVITRCVVSTLLAVLQREGSQQLRLVGELSEVSDVLANATSERRRMIHDARNLVAAMGTANATLERHGHRLDPALRAQLEGMVGSELERLQDLLAPRGEDPAYPA